MGEYAKSEIMIMKSGRKNDKNICHVEFSKSGAEFVIRPLPCYLYIPAQVIIANF